jgi:putative hydrolase of the HAD superfamily
MRYDAVIFDLFGTLVENFWLEDYRSVLHEMADLLGVPGEEFIEGWSGTFRLRVAGAFRSVEENIRHLYVDLADGARIEEATRVRLEFTRRSLLPAPDAVATLASLKRSGHLIGLISDCSVEVPALWDTTPFTPLFDAAVFSCEVSIKKPDPRIYRIACDRLGVRPERVLYVGDGGSSELSGAAAVGMHPVLIRRPDDVSGDLVRIDGEEWDGDVVGTLAEVLDLV